MFGPPSPRFTQVCTLQGLIAQVLILRVANFQVLADVCIGKCQYWKSEGCALHLAKLRLRRFISPHLVMRFVQEDVLRASLQARRSNPVAEVEWIASLLCSSQ